MDQARTRDPESLRALDVIVHFFDAYATRYDAWAAGLHQRVAGRLVELAAPAGGEVCLDVGCGTGLVANAFGQAVGRKGQVIGIDVSAGMLDRARAGAHRNTRYQKISADPHLWFREGTFDVVAFCDSLTYLTDPMASLLEARRVLRPGGRVVVATHRRSVDTVAQEVFFGMLDEFMRDHPFAIPRPRDQRAVLGEPKVLAGIMRDAGFEEASTTMMATGARVESAAQWLELMAGAGPRPYALLESLGPGVQRRLLEAVDGEMRRLGDEAFHYHVAYTFGVGRVTAEDAGAATA